MKLKLKTKVKPKAKLTAKLTLKKVRTVPEPGSLSLKPKAKHIAAFDPTGSVLRPKSMFPLCDLRVEAGFIERVNLNSQITSILERLIDATKGLRATCTDPKEKKKQDYRINSFTNALNIIKSHPEPISSGKEAMSLKGIGKGIANRIDEILASGSLEELDELSKIDESTRAIMELCTITGIGEVKARKLHDDFGVMGVADLAQKYQRGDIKLARNQLTHHIAVGMQFYEDLQQRIPWSEVDQIRVLLQNYIDSMEDVGLQLVVCGSYRRHKKTCGDIDVLLTHMDVDTLADATKVDYLPDFVDKLAEDGILIGHLTERGRTKYMGVCRLREGLPGRRIDIRFVPRQSYAAAMLYFTGSGQFNKLMRFKANERGYTINEYGIFTYVNGIKGEQIPTETEEDIFKVINCVYIEPTEREFDKPMRM